MANMKKAVGEIPLLFCVNRGHLMLKCILRFHAEQAKHCANNKRHSPKTMPFMYPCTALSPLT